MAEDAEVRVRLVADDLTAAVVEGVKASMTQLREEQEKTTKAAGEGEGLTGSLIKANLVTEGLKGSAELVTEAIHQSYEMMEKLADAALEAADAQEKQVRTMAGNLFLIDQGRHGMASLRDYSTEMREEFAKAGIEMGVTTASITEAFNQLVSRGTMGSEKAKELAIQMTEVGKIVPGGMEALAQGFSMVELGMVRARNPIVQLIAATHTLQGNAHQVADEMQKMSPEKQMELAEKAIAKQSEALKKMGGIGPATLPELKTSFEGFKEGALEGIGKPIEAVLIPELTKLRSFLIEHREQIEHFSEVIGEKVGKMVEYLSQAIQGIYEGFVEDWGQIQHLAEEMKGAWEEIFGKAGDTRTQFRILADDLVQVFAGLLHTVEMANDIAHAQKLGTTELNVQQKVVEGAAGRSQSSEGLATFQKEVEKYKRLQGEMGEGGTALAEQMTDQFKNMALLARGPARAAKENLDTLNGPMSEQDAYERYLEASLKKSDEGAEEYALHLLVGSARAKEALDIAASHMEGGMDALMKVVSERAPELAKQLKEAAAGHIGKEGITPPQHNMNFYGAHFDIKQDFKDADPDRMLLMFTDKLVRSARSRIESRVATPFGL